MAKRGVPVSPGEAGDGALRRYLATLEAAGSIDTSQLAQAGQSGLAGDVPDPPGRTCSRWPRGISAVVAVATRYKLRSHVAKPGRRFDQATHLNKLAGFRSTAPTCSKHFRGKRKRPLGLPESMPAVEGASLWSCGPALLALGAHRRLPPLASPSPPRHTNTCLTQDYSSQAVFANRPKITAYSVDTVRVYGSIRV